MYNTSKEDKAPSLDEIAPSEDFSDMENYGWAKDAVNYLKKGGIISGTGNNKFSPQREIKREELLKMLVLMLESEGVKTEYEYEDIFEDVPSNSWYAEYVLKGYRSGLTGGISESLFGAGKSVTREDAAVFVSRAAALMGRKFENNKDMELSDKDGIADYAKPAVSELCGAGIINGFEDDTFRPKAFCTRAQVCRIIYSALGKENFGE